MGLLDKVGADLDVTISTAGLLISGYALGVAVGAPIFTIAVARWSQKHVLLAMMGVFVMGNIACALAPSYTLLMAARVLTASAHGTFFGVGSVVATRLVAPERRATAIAIMFTGLTVANVIGVPLGTWIGQQAGWRMAFWVVSMIGVLAFTVIALAVPSDKNLQNVNEWRADLRVVARRPVLFGFATTVLGFAGVFAVFTYIAPLLTRVGGFGEAAISPILLLFGCGMVLGNLLGGRLADRAIMPAILGILSLLFAVLVAAGPLLTFKIGTLFTVTALGLAGFALVAPLQVWVLQNARGAGENLVSSFNIAATNLGIAGGAWAGGATLDALGLHAITWIAAIFPLAALAMAASAADHVPIIIAERHP